jgi:hypothetical protein
MTWIQIRKICLYLMMNNLISTVIMKMKMTNKQVIKYIKFILDKKDQ